MPATLCYSCWSMKLAKKSKLSASCVCMIDAVGKLKLHFEASDDALLDLEFTKCIIFGTWPTSGFKAAILASLPAHMNLFIWAVTTIEASKQGEGHTSRYTALLYS